MGHFKSKIWIVVEDNPWPDRYIPVFVRYSDEIREINWKIYQYRIFEEEEKAIGFAIRLRNRYGARYIRMFYPDGISKRMVLQKKS